MLISIVIPVYNRPDEMSELLYSLSKQEGVVPPYEVIVIEDGSSISSEEVINHYRDSLSIHYYKVPNGGPSKARNIGASHASGDWIVILDSDVVLPPLYLHHVARAIEEEQPCDAWGGPDAARTDFTPVQQAINYAMTSPLTTGGIRGGAKRLTKKFYPRSFNLGVRRPLFERLHGFDESMRFGEDIDFSLRLYESGAAVRLFVDASVFHKRRVDFKKFFKQVFNSGIARVHLSERHPGSMRITYLLPALFVLATLAVLIASLWLPLLGLLYVCAFIGVVAIDAAFRTKSLRVAMLSVVATFVQFFAYGSGYLYALVRRYIFGQRGFNSFAETLYD